MSSHVASDRMLAIRSANVLGPRDAARLYERAWADSEERVQIQAITETVRYGFRPELAVRLLDDAAIRSMPSVQSYAASRRDYFKSEGGRQMAKRRAR